MWPEGFNITHSPNHWSNEDIVIEHLETVILPYVNATRDRLGLSDDHKALLIYDVFRGQMTQKVRDLVEENNCLSVYVPANLTNEFQPLDLTINGPAKQFLVGKFQDWYASQITKQIERGINVYSIEVGLQLSIMKPIHANWLLGLYDHLRNMSQTIKKGFDMAGISEALTMELETEDPFADLE